MSALAESHFNNEDHGLHGFRLQNLSVLNWGTFDHKVWELSPECQNSLLTGNIGSGKSTMVDGLTSLLVPTRKLAFNKAAGAEDKERSLESYFHGYYTSQQDEFGKARSIGLRKDKHYSVVLAQFRSGALKQSITLAQVFWLKPGEKKVKRLFVVAQTALTITEHFSNFGSQINQLKKQLRKNEQLELFDTFPPYAQCFSKLLGLGADGKALELFNQTISMKSVGSVTDFVRQNMLEQPDVEAQLQELERNYDDLKRLHDAVVDARQKVELLTPVDDYGKQALLAANDKTHIEQCRELTEPYMAKLAIDLYQTRLHKRRQALQKLNIKLAAFEHEKTQLDENLNQLREDIRSNGGGRLQQLEKDIRQLADNRESSRKLCNNYQKLVGELGLPAQLSSDAFVHNINAAKDQVEEFQQQREAIDEQQFTLKQEQAEQQSRQKELTELLTSLKQRKSNISLKQIHIREHLCEHLGVSEDRLPFVGELIQVKASAALWQGAIERVLHNFALSLMVPDDLYQDVCDFVENTHLGTRLVYYRIRQPQNYYPAASESHSLLAKIEIKPDSEHYDWLDQELHKRFDYACCDDMAEFRRSVKAITPKGQIKSGQFRHEKDDRNKLQDKSRYVLGWSNKDKIQLLAAQYNQLEQKIAQLQAQLNQVKSRQQQVDNKARQALNLADFNFSFEQINWSRYSEQIAQLQQEKQQLEQTSDVLKDLQVKLAAQVAAQAAIENKLKQSYVERGQHQSDIEKDESALTQAQKEYQSAAPAFVNKCFPTLDEFYQKYLGDSQVRINMLANVTSQLRTKLNERVQHLEERRRKKQGQMINAMSSFAHDFPNDVTELDRSPEALPEYQQMLKQLQEEDLPRHEQRFKEMLNRDTIRAMALFRSYLDKQEEEIDGRIRLINQSLHGLDYQNGTYIEIDSINSADVEIRDFKQRLKSCVEFSTDDSLYSEEKFQRVKDLIEQMRNEPKWTQKVVDVRYWHLFNVIERYREDNKEKECYSDSGGKSGGQKEKLAYSILAAAILLQYGLVNNEQQPEIKAKRRFNLVVIDEAFARGSKDSTRFGLELFKKLGLQLLLVTPLQKLDVIEHYVKHVHFVDQKNNRSMLLNMTIDQYRERLAQHKSISKYENMVKQVS
ncbi:hypothetical protein SG34_024990 [Thalassomonas viridans]|uniref:ATP-binding protein n=1 Tax=Thalassomonas viridans TaxID=137584 RepID=A0AAE9Z0G5_9GAMM|nr:ATP-binding protein [Thalassomonas viridans]WDE04551.1 hypothetical protein SG34_024990 [Thalassomonas viridans]